MAVCTYDNPATMRRECWQDGKLIRAYSVQLLLRALGPNESQPIPGKYLFFGANIGDWREGQFVGDEAAMTPNEQA